MPTLEETMSASSVLMALSDLFPYLCPWRWKPGSIARGIDEVDPAEFTGELCSQDITLDVTIYESQLSLSWFAGIDEYPHGPYDEIDDDEKEVEWVTLYSHISHAFDEPKRNILSINPVEVASGIVTQWFTRNQSVLEVVCSAFKLPEDARAHFDWMTGELKSDESEMKPRESGKSLFAKLRELYTPGESNDLATIVNHPTLNLAAVFDELQGTPGELDDDDELQGDLDAIMDDLGLDEPIIEGLRSWIAAITDPAQRSPAALAVNTATFAALIQQHDTRGDTPNE